MANQNKKVVEFWVGLSQPTIDKYIAKGILYLDPVDGSVEKLCKQCEEWWPLSSEFWYTDKTLKLGVHSWCKACYRNIRKEREAGKRA